MFYLYHHNDLDRLAELFAVLRQQSDPLALDTVLVPNRGLGRWLTIQLTESEGIAANLEFALPGETIWQLLRAVLPGAQASARFEAEALPWHLYAHLPAMARHIEPVAHYLGEPIDEIRRYQLARRLADVFEQYLIYRGDMLAHWETGATPAASPGDWQARVWRYLTYDAGLGVTHRANLLRQFVGALDNDPKLATRVRAHCPPRLFCFGLITLAPDHLRFLYALAELIDVHFMLPNPSAEYWGDITAARLALSAPIDEELDSERMVAAGHPLLGALGRTARDTLRVLYSDELAGIAEPELGATMDYTRPSRDTLLGRIQADIVQLAVSPSDDGMAADDASLAIHACHSPLREIQVLHDQLLDYLAADDKRVAAGEITDGQRLTPRDIVVMLPYVADYAPAIASVFGGAPEARFIPYEMADRSRVNAHPIAACVATLLDLPLWRWRASEVLALLAVPAVMRRFDLNAGEVDRLTRWAQAAGVRWGRDGAHRAQLKAGTFEQNSWRFGLDRLLLGVAQADNETLTAGVAPWSDLEGGATAALGKLWRATETLAHYARILAEPAAARVWQTRLNALIDAILAPDPGDALEQRAIDDLRKTFASLETAADCLDDTQVLSFDAVREMLRQAFNEPRERQPFLASGVTFCGLVPLRAVPFRIVCILGLNDDAFPRQEANRSFNVMFGQPRRGDRNRRNDDRLLFLQALTAARDVFYISYIGQDAHTGEVRPPSPIVGETLEFIHRYYFRNASTAAFRDRLIHDQPMQPFSTRYFSPAETDPRVFTFAGAWRAAAQTSLGERHPRAPLLDGSRAPATESVTTIDLVSLKAFFDHPPRAFFRERAKLDLEIEDIRLKDEEPIALEALDASDLRRRLLATADAAGLEMVALTPSALERARGLLPPPPLAGVEYAPEAEAVNELLPIWRAWQTEAKPETLDIDLDIDGIRITGRVDQLWPGALRRLRTGRLKTKFRLRYWIDYLAVCASGQPCRLELAGFNPNKKATGRIAYAAELAASAARQELAKLVRLFIDGQCRPLTFHPDLADEYQPGQNKAFANVAYRFKLDAWSPHHLTRDAYFALMLDGPDAPLGDPEDNAFVAAIEAVTATMNQELTPVVAQP